MVLNRKETNIKRRGLPERVYEVKRDDEFTKMKISDLVQGDLLRLNKGDVAPAEIELLNDKGSLEAVIPEGTVITDASVIGRIRKTRNYKSVKARSKRSTSRKHISTIRFFLILYLAALAMIPIIKKDFAISFVQQLKILAALGALVMRDHLKTYFRALTATAEEKLLAKDGVVQSDVVIDELGFVDVVDIDLDGSLTTVGKTPSRIATISDEQINLFDVSSNNKVTSRGFEIDVSRKMALGNWEKGKIVDLEEVIDRITQFVDDETGRETAVFNKEMKSKIEQLMVVWSKEYRVCAAVEDVGTNVRLIAVLGFHSPLRDNAYSAVEDLTRAGMKVVISSSAPSDSVIAYAEKLRIPISGIVLGSEWRSMSDAERITAVKTRNLFAKFTSEDREKLVSVQKNSLKQKVAFVSDSVDEIDAMKLADVGVCLETSCQGLQSVASLVLKNNTITALPEAVFMSRGARKSYHNVLNYITGTSFAVCSGYGLCLYSGYALLFNPSRILGLSLVTFMHALLLATDVTPRTARKSFITAFVRNLIIFVVIPAMSSAFNPATMTIRLIKQSGQLKEIELLSGRMSTLGLVGFLAIYNLCLLTHRSSRWTWLATLSSLAVLFVMMKTQAIEPIGDITGNDWIIANFAVVPVCIVYKILTVFN